jgi:CO/xanthine dehydrogenase Mo-binding subunit
MTMLSQIVAHELDIPLAYVHVVPPDTDMSPYCIGSLASRVTIVAGNAAIAASRLAKDALRNAAAQVFKVAESDIDIAGGCATTASLPDRRLTYGELVRAHIWRHGGEGIHVQGSWDANTVMHDDNLYGNVAPAYSFAAQVVEVEVDTETGRVKVIDSFVSDDCGKALNPLAVHGQSNGASAQAIGWALYEHLQLEDGRIANGEFSDYIMPTADALPFLQSGIVESNDPNGPFGAKGASETAILPGAPAIANAIYHAVGVRIRNLPITPEKVLAALKEKQGAANA